jgi:hypothetical protein
LHFTIQIFLVVGKLDVGLDDVDIGRFEESAYFSDIARPDH